MAILTVQPSYADGGTAFVPVAAAGGGDSFPNTGQEVFYVNNGSGVSVTVTFDSPATCDFGLANNAAHDRVVTVAAGAQKIVGPFDMTRFNDVNGRVQVTYSAVTTVTVAVIDADQ